MRWLEPPFFPWRSAVMSVTAASQTLKFDVLIGPPQYRQRHDPRRRGGFRVRFVAVNARLDMLVTEAFGIPPNLADLMIAGGIRRDARCNRNCSSREDILSARFDIQATFPGEIPAAQRPAVLRAFLEDRFPLKTHFETDNAPCMS